jgi:hypothetical protein
VGKSTSCKWWLHLGVVCGVVCGVFALGGFTVRATDSWSLVESDSAARE